jgi:hypothetical protein
VFEQLVEIIAPGLVISVLTAYLTVHFSLWRFRSEKWWERKAQTYSDTMEALYKIKSHAEDFAEGVSIESKNSSQASFEGRAEIDRVIAVSSFVVSEEALEHLEKFRRKSRDLILRAAYQSVENEDGNFDRWQRDYAKRELEAANACLESLRECAKRGLRMSSPTSSMLRKVTKR